MKLINNADFMSSETKYLLEEKVLHLIITQSFVFLGCFVTVLVNLYYMLVCSLGCLAAER